MTKKTITVHLDLTAAIADTLDYLAERWEVERPAPQETVAEAIVKTVELHVEDMISDWSWYLWDDPLGHQLEDTVNLSLQRATLKW
jgi:hypothetical protein